MKFFPRIPAASLAALCFAFPPFAGAGVVPGGCLADRASFLGQNCTSNDVTFVLVGLGNQSDGCVAGGSALGGDSVTILLRAVVQNSTAQTRYDIGLWFATDGDPNADGALTGICGREMLHPAYFPVDDADAQNADCPPLDLGGGAGEYFSGEPSVATTDACGDLLDSHAADPDECDTDPVDGVYDDSIMDFVTPQIFPCRDIDTTADGGLPVNGRLNIPTCASWGNQQGQVHMGTCSVTTSQFCQADNDCPGSETCDVFGTAGLCDSENELMNGTAAKCACEDTDTDIPRADVGLSCSCISPTTVRPGFPVVCTVSYDNPSPVGLFGINADLPNSLQAGTAGYIRFVTNQGTDLGVFSGVSTTSGTTVIPGSNASITWNPEGGRCDGTDPCSDPGDPVAPEANVIGPGETGDLDFTYTVDAGASDGPILLLTTTQWSADSAFSIPVNQSAVTTTCAITVDSTDALVVNVDARQRADGNLVLSWDTASETGSVGFEVKRFNTGKGYFERVNKELIPATQHAPGGHYLFVDSGVSAKGALGYQIVEHDTQGKTRTFGPYRFDTLAELSPAHNDAQIDKTGSFAAQARAPSATTLKRFESARRVDTSKASRPQSAGRARVLVEEDGLQFVPVQSIARALGLSELAARAMIDQTRVRLSHVAAEVPWKQAPNADGIYFYGKAGDSLFSDYAVYWLERGEGSRVPHKIGDAPEGTFVTTFFNTVHFEQDLLGRPAVAKDPLEDYWFWKGLIGGHETLGTQDFQFDLNDVAASLQDATLRIDLFGFNNPDSGLDHRAFLILNGELLGELVWTGTGAHYELLSINPTLLREGSNTLSLVADSGAFFVDGFDVGYQHKMVARYDRLTLKADGNPVVTVRGFSNRRIQVWDVTDSASPVFTKAVDIRDFGGQWQASFQPSWTDAVYVVNAAPAQPEIVPARGSDLRNRANAAQYLVIAPEKIVGEAGQLAAYRSGEYSTMVATVESIMDEFNYGNYDPVAIREFFRYASQEWAVAPEYTVLAGKGSYDYRDLMGLGGNLVPPMMVPTNLSGLVPSDNAFVDFDADSVPDMKLGRLPVLSGEEMLAAVSKLSMRENAMATDTDWLGRVLMLADDADGAGDFSADSEALARLLPTDAQVQDVHFGVTHDFDGARGAIAASLGQGVGLMNFVGHGGFDRLAAEGLLTSGDLETLGESTRLPFVTAFTCNIGLHAFPGFVSLGENLVMSPDNGAIAVLAPTGQNLNTRSVELGSHVFNNWTGQDVHTVGDAAVNAMRDYLDAGGNADVLRSYSILGDPASPVMQ